MPAHQTADADQGWLPLAVRQAPGCKRKGKQPAERIGGYPHRRADRGTGVAGSGKSSLIHHEFLRQHPDAVVIDQSTVSISTRSNPATYTGIMDDIRTAFATANKVSPSLISFTSKGACENCQAHPSLHKQVGDTCLCDSLYWSIIKVRQ